MPVPKTPPRASTPPGRKPLSTFADLLLALPGASAVQGGGFSLTSDPLAGLPYPEEVALKAEAFGRFWKRHGLPGQPEALVAARRPRQYRTTSKRRVVFAGGEIRLVSGDGAIASAKTPAFVPSPLEPVEHEAIYRFLLDRLRHPSMRLLAGHLNYLVIRGSYAERAVIFNVDRMNGPIVRKLKLLAEQMKEQAGMVSAALIYPDPTRSDYYLESRRPEGAVALKRLYGPETLQVRHCGLRYDFSPVSFSQVNEAMVPTMLELARNFLQPAAGGMLVDLYCGYGLFSLFLAPSYAKVLAIDAGGPSIKAAIRNRRGVGRHVSFRVGRIAGPSLESTLEREPPGFDVLLDPPRQGPLPGVIGALARCTPRRVVHIFCGVDQIPDSASQWKENGYEIRRVLPLDLFPGTTGLEVMVLFTPREP